MQSTRKTTQHSSTSLIPSAQTYRTNGRSIQRKGNVLAGCLVALGVATILIVLATIFVMNSWRGWVSKGFESGLTAVLNEATIAEAEKEQITAHVSRLMQRFEDKEISLEDLGLVMQELAESPLVPAALVGSIDAMYFSQSSLSEDQITDGKVQLARYSEGLFSETIDPKSLDDVLDPITTNTPDENDIRLNMQISMEGDQIVTALRSSDEVTDEDLLELISLAKAAADEAQIQDTPEPIDFSNELGRAIANALGEDVSIWITDEEEFVPTEDDTSMTDDSNSASDTPVAEEEEEEEEAQDGP